MGCCLTKKSRENRIKRDKSPLLNDNSGNEHRGLSLHLEKSEILPHTQSITSQDPSNHDYEPPNQLTNDNKSNKVVVGTSLLASPSVDALYKAEMIEKRGHLVGFFTYLKLSIDRYEIGKKDTSYYMMEKYNTLIKLIKVVKVLA